MTSAPSQAPAPRGQCAAQEKVQQVNLLDAQILRHLSQFTGGAGQSIERLTNCLVLAGTK